MAARRRFRRIPLRDGEAHLETVVETKADVLDLCSEGIGLRSMKRVHPGRPCTVVLGDNGTRLVIEGRSVWERYAGRDITSRGILMPFFSTGIRFDEAHDELLALTCSGNGCGRSVRWSPESQTALLSYPELFTVRSISLGGMLTESWNPLKIDTELTGRLYLPGEPSPLEFLGKVIFTDPVMKSDGKVYLVGFEYISMQEQHAERLEAFIRIRSAL